MWAVQAAGSVLYAVYNYVRDSWPLSVLWAPPSPSPYSPSSARVLAAIRALHTLPPVVEEKGSSGQRDRTEAQSERKCVSSSLNKDVLETQQNEDIAGEEEMSGRIGVDGNDLLSEGAEAERSNSTSDTWSSERAESRDTDAALSDQAESGHSATSAVQEVLSLIESLPSDENLLDVVNEEGYNLLQHAVTTGHSRLVALVLRRWGLGRPQCSPPAHLAALLGHTHILKMLLEAGASGTSKRGVCYPLPHKAVGERSSLLGLARQPCFPCTASVMTPLQAAVSGDRVQCVRLLLSHVQPQCRSSTFCLDLLHFACKHGATLCLDLMVRAFPDIVNAYNAAGDTPLLTAVPWGWKCVKILVENGADVHCRSRTLGETALHRLYRMNMDGLFTIFDTTQYLLTTGIEQDINALTSLQESPLHMLVSHVSYAGGNFVDPARRTVPRPSLQEDYQQQVVRALRAILQFNADPHLLNGAGLQALSRMLHIALKACCPQDPSECVQTSQPDRFIVEYRNDYHTLQQALDVLLEHQADVNFRCQAGHTPVILLLQCCLHDSVASLCRQRAGVLAALTLLLQSGADLGFVARGDNTCATLVALVCQRYFTDEVEPALRADYADLCDAILTLLLRHGMNPNYTSQRSAPYLRGGNGNAVVEFVRLAACAREVGDFAVLHRWLKTLLQWGADPNLEPYPCEPIICHSQSSIFLKKQGTQALGHLIRKVQEREAVFAGSGAQDLLLLFYSSMEHRPLYEALAAARADARWPLLTPGGAALLERVATLGTNPRSLRQIARVAIYSAMRYRLASSVHSLPLPALLQTYLLEIS